MSHVATICWITTWDTSPPTWLLQMYEKTDHQTNECNTKRDMGRLFVIIVPIGRKHFNNNLGVKNAIHQTVFPRNLPAPTIFGFPLQWFGVTKASLRMCLQLCDKPISFGKSLWLALCKALQIQCRFRHNDNIIRHTRCALEKFPNLPPEAFSSPHHEQLDLLHDPT